MLLFHLFALFSLFFTFSQTDTLAFHFSFSLSLSSFFLIPFHFPPLLFFLFFLREISLSLSSFFLLFSFFLSPSLLSPFSLSLHPSALFSLPTTKRRRETRSNRPPPSSVPWILFRVEQPTEECINLHRSTLARRIDYYFFFFNIVASDFLIASMIFRSRPRQISLRFSFYLLPRFLNILSSLLYAIFNIEEEGVYEGERRDGGLCWKGRERGKIVKVDATNASSPSESFHRSLQSLHRPIVHFTIAICM